MLHLTSYKYWKNNAHVILRQTIREVDYYIRLIDYSFYYLLLLVLGLNLIWFMCSQLSSNMDLVYKFKFIKKRSNNIK